MLYRVRGRVTNTYRKYVVPLRSIRQSDMSVAALLDTLCSLILELEPGSIEYASDHSCPCLELLCQRSEAIEKDTMMRTMSALTSMLAVSMRLLAFAVIGYGP